MKRFLLTVSVALCCMVCGSVRVSAQEAQPDPELERRTFKVAEGFEVSLFAADPLVAKPIEMNFDDKGRLWIAVQNDDGTSIGDLGEPVWRCLSLW